MDFIIDEAEVEDDFYGSSDDESEQSEDDFSASDI